MIIILPILTLNNNANDNGYQSLLTLIKKFILVKKGEQSGF